MALDRYVYWREYTPTIDEIHRAVEDYVSGLALSVKHDGHFTVICLPGDESTPMRRQNRASHAARHRFDDETSPRGIELYIGPDHLDVITRMSDEVTCAIADGFADFALRFWQGSKHPASATWWDRWGYTAWMDYAVLPYRRVRNRIHGWLRPRDKDED